MHQYRPMLIVLLLLLLTAAGQGNGPRTLSYQGVLADSAGIAVQNGTYQLLFRIYTQAGGGPAIWEESQTAFVQAGIFSVILGKVNPLELAFDTPYWLGITVGTGSELQPRTELTAVAYSMYAQAIADSIVTGQKIADGQVVRSLNGLRDQVNIAAGDNITLTPQGNTLVISAGDSLTGGGNSPWVNIGTGIYYNSGQVGIGTATPVARVHSAGAGSKPAYFSSESSVDFAVPDNQPMQFSHWDGSAVSTERMRITTNGNMGIGTETPGIFPGAYRYLTLSASQTYTADRTMALELQGSSNAGSVPVARIDFGAAGNNGETGNIARIHAETGTNNQTTGELVFFVNDGISLNEALKIVQNGDMGIGVTNPASKLDVNGSITANGSIAAKGMSIDRTGNSTALDIQHSGSLTTNLVNIETSAGPPIFTNILQIKTGDQLAPDAQFIECLRGSDAEFRVNGDGDVTADGTFTGGGADFAEMMQVSAGASSVEAGDVLVIDPENPRAIAKSSQPGSTLVAGIYSSKPGFLGSEREWDKTADGETGSYTISEIATLFNEIPMAVVGIVPCKVSAENGPIRPGNLLVTSATPGHAMRDDHPENGTIVGKALGSLPAGTGLIQVLVTLQ